MDRRTLVSVLVVSLLAIVIVASPSSAGERFERTLNYEVPHQPGTPFHFENLLGSLTVRGDRTDGKVLVEARVVAEADSRDAAEAITDSIRLVNLGEQGRSVIRVDYPVDRHSAFRLPRSEKDGLIDKWVTPLVRKSTVSTVYAGQTVEVGQTKGSAAVCVHVKITLPMDVDASFKQVVGTLHAIAIRGNFALEAVEGQILADQAYGSLQARTGGGEVLVRKFGGDGFRLQTGSGNVTLMEVKANNATLLTGSGKIEGTGITTESLEVDSGSGGVFLEGVDSVAFEVSSESGQVEVAAKITRTREASIINELGNVVLRVNPRTPFELRALSKSGSVKHRDLSAEILDEEKNALHLQRGKGGAALEVTTGKGEVVIRSI